MSERTHSAPKLCQPRRCEASILSVSPRPRRFIAPRRAAPQPCSTPAPPLAVRCSRSFLFRSSSSPLRQRQDRSLGRNSLSPRAGPPRWVRWQDQGRARSEAARLWLQAPVPLANWRRRRRRTEAAPASRELRLHSGSDRGAKIWIQEMEDPLFKVRRGSRSRDRTGHQFGAGAISILPPTNGARAAQAGDLMLRASSLVKSDDSRSSTPRWRSGTTRRAGNVMAYVSRCIGHHRCDDTTPRPAHRLAGAHPQLGRGQPRWWTRRDRALPGEVAQGGARRERIAAHPS